MTTDQPDIPPLPLGRPVLAAALALGIGVAVDILAFRHPAGFGLMIAGLLVLLAVALAPRWAARPSPSRWTIVVGALAMAFVGLRSSPTLTGLNLLLFGVSATIAVHQLTGSRVRDWTIFDYVRNGVLTCGRIASEASSYVLTDLRPLRTRYDTSHMRPVVFGLALGFPLVILFTGLFASADAAFADLLGNLFSMELDLTGLVSRIVTVALTTATVLGIWRFGLTERREPSLSALAGWTLDGRTAATSLGLLVALFASFVGVQITYLFGGSSALEGAGLTYAEYARRGFFELVAVSALVLGVVLALDWATHRGGRRRARSVDGLATALIGLTFVILASAGYRMSLYTSEFGLTELRLYTSVFMGWVGLVLAWSLVTVLRSRRDRFALGAFVAGVAMVIGLNLVNPDAIIANINLHNASVDLDVEYLSALSSDAAPTIAAFIASTDPDCASTERMLNPVRQAAEPIRDWRSTTVADLRARAALAGLAECER